MIREDLFLTIKEKEEAVAEEQQTIKDEEEEVVEEEVAEEEVVEEEVLEEEVVEDMLKGMLLLLTIKDPEEEVMEEEDVEELLKFTQEEGVMVGIPKALVHRWRRHSYRRLSTL